MEDSRKLVRSRGGSQPNGRDLAVRVSSKGIETRNPGA